MLVVCDAIEDPHNLGAILRTCECVGAHGVIIPQRRAAGLNQTVYKTSAGAVEYVKVARVVNLVSTLQQLKEQGFWVFGTDMQGTPWCQCDFSGPVALVVGNEGKGMSPLVKKQCDVVATLPMAGKIRSLNASVAASVVLYEIARQRLSIQAR